MFMASPHTEAKHSRAQTCLVAGGQTKHLPFDPSPSLSLSHMCFPTDQPLAQNTTNKKLTIKRAFLFYLMTLDLDFQRLLQALYFHVPTPKTLLYHFRCNQCEVEVN